MLARTREGDVLRLWDTPGLGDSARLLKRLTAYLPIVQSSAERDAFCAANG